MLVNLYVLHGHWNTTCEDGTNVIGVSEDIEELNEKLEHIEKTKASDYLKNPYGDTYEEIGWRYYEISDDDGGYARFYITEHQVKLSEPLMGMISCEMAKIDQTRDVKEYLKDMYESDNVEPWKYQYINDNQEVINEILALYYKLADCNVSYNATIGNAVDNILKTLVMDDEKLEFLWEQFGDVLVDDDECILDDFVGFECGTHREAVWQWFDKHYSRGVAALMN